MKFISNICYGKAKHSEQYLDIYLPDKDSFKVFVYMHGGGLEAGDKCSAKVVGEYLSEQGVAFVSINYRLYPQAMYPQFICNAAEAVRWVYDHIGEYGICEGIYIGGSSAGGYLSMMLCFDDKYLSPYNLPADIIKGYVHDAGQPTTHYNVLRERGIDSRRVIIDEAAPIYHIGKADKYPPMMFIVSDNDMKNRYEQTQLIISTLKHFEYDESKIYYRLMHGTHCHYSATEEFGRMICEFIKETEK
ncbi:MAG: alpha/beta hydrolase [Clostridia bacterium]|nr:alpha/beta hydrolase [Clostridia bacterium]